jgi:hypothetical protein
VSEKVPECAASYAQASGSLCVHVCATSCTCRWPSGSTRDRVGFHFGECRKGSRVIKRGAVNGRPKNAFASGSIECNATFRGDVESAFVPRPNMAKVEFARLLPRDPVHRRIFDRDFARLARPVFSVVLPPWQFRVRHCLSFWDSQGAPPGRPGTIVCQMRHTLPGHWCKVVHRSCESDDLEIGGDLYVWIWIDRYPGDYLSGRVARTRFVIAKSRS